MSINRWMTEDVVHIYKGILLSHKKKIKNNAICSNMAGPGDYHTKWSKPEKDYVIWYHISDISLTCEPKIWHKRTFLQKKHTHRHREKTCGCQGSMGVGEGWTKFGISRCKLLYLEWINNKVLLYTTRNYTRYAVINYNHKEYEKECTCMYNWVTLLKRN